MNKQTEPFLLDASVAAESAPQVGISRPHESAHLHVAGTATYTDDIPELAGTLHAALGMSARAHARLKSIGLERVRKAPGVVSVLTVDDIPGANECGPIIHDDPILVKDVVQFIGQPIFIVVATSHDAARRAARLADIEYEDLPPVLSPEAAHAAGSYVLPPMHLKRGEPARHIDAAIHRDAGKIHLGGQEQFYLEGQIAYAVPRENDGMHVWCSTQHPTEMQHHVAHTCSAGTRIRCWWSAAAWAVASAARNRSRPCSRAARRWPRGSCCARSSCVQIATTT